MSRKINDKRFFLEILDYQESDSTKKINCFPAQNSSTTVTFQTEFMLEKFEPVVAEEYKFESGSE